MSTINVKVEVSSFDDPKNQCRFATATAINKVLTTAQEEERKHLNDAFTLRRKAWADRGIKIKPFANKTTLTGTIAVDPAGNNNVFAKFEDQTVKTPLSGHHIAIPTENAQKDKFKVIPKSKRPVNLKNTVKITFKDGNAALYQHKGSGKRARLVMMYYLQNSVPLKPVLKFHDTVEQSVRENWQKAFSEAWEKAYATAK